jgi:hypothetical protein
MQVALNPIGEIGVAVSDESAETHPRGPGSGNAMALKRTYRESENVRCLLLIEEGIHRILPLTGLRQR